MSEVPMFVLKSYVIDHSTINVEFVAGDPVEITISFGGEIQLKFDSGDKEFLGLIRYLFKRDPTFMKWA